MGGGDAGERFEGRGSRGAAPSRERGTAARVSSAARRAHLSALVREP